MQILEIAAIMSGFRCQFSKGSLTRVHYPKLYKMAHLLSLNVFTASKGSNNYILFMRGSLGQRRPMILKFGVKHQ